MTRDHKGIAYREQQEGFDGRPIGHRVTPDLRRTPPRCGVCGRQVHYVRKTYGPRGRIGFWQHSGDGLAQYRSWSNGAA